MTVRSPLVFFPHWSSRLGLIEKRGSGACVLGNGDSSGVKMVGKKLGTIEYSPPPREPIQVDALHKIATF